MEVITKPVPGWPLYSVTRDGQVFGQKGQLLKPQKSDTGYLRFTTCTGGKLKTVLVHRAVALAFIGDPPDDERICVGHGNGNPSDNRVENLRWVTYEENWDDRRRHGNDGRGAQNGRAKFSQEKAVELRRSYATGNYSYVELASMFDISPAQANKIGRGLYWP